MGADGYRESLLEDGETSRCVCGGGGGGWHGDCPILELVDLGWGLNISQSGLGEWE